MKNQKLFLDHEEEDELRVGLIRLVKKIPDYEFFYQLNLINDSAFSRSSDFEIKRFFYNYHHFRYEGYLPDIKSCFSCFSNQSFTSFQKKNITELFSKEEDINYLLPNYKEVDFIIKTSDNFTDFSVILFPEKLIFPIQEYYISNDEELYQLIQYYE